MCTCTHKANQIKSNQSTDGPFVFFFSFPPPFFLKKARNTGGNAFVCRTLAARAKTLPQKIVPNTEQNQLLVQIQHLDPEMQNQPASWTSINTNMHDAALLPTMKCRSSRSSSFILSGHSSVAAKYNSARTAIANRLKHPFGALSIPPRPKPSFSRKQKRPKCNIIMSSFSESLRFSAGSEEKAQIQVTGNRKSWYDISVTDIRDARVLQDRILERMGLKGKRDDYYYYCENDSSSEDPMSLSAMQYLCTMARTPDRSRPTIRVRVLPIPLAPITTVNADPRHPTSANTLATDFSDMLPTPDLTPSSSPVSTYSYEPIQLPDPLTPKHDIIHDPSGRKVAAPSCNDDLWAVTSFMPPQLPVQLWAIPPRHSKGSFWGERPPAEVVCQNMDTYFEEHDLDKVIPDSVSTHRHQPLAHCKSLRTLAQEATQKYTMDTSTPRQPPIRRRKSTKMWGQTIVEVKPTGVDTPSSAPNTRAVTGRVELAADAVGSPSSSANERVQQWVRGKLIGKGSFGRVYLAFNVASEEVIAVKQVPRSGWCAQEEIRMMQDLDHHNIVQYLGYGHEENVSNIFLEYVAGGSIQSWLDRHGAFDEPLVRYFSRQILQGLAYLHAKNIMHRDIKAANILVEEDGTCKISDFGVSAKNSLSDHQVSSSICSSLRGSVYWMAPEVVKNEPYGPTVDIWGLGCAVLEMFTGRRPWFYLDQVATLYHLGHDKAPYIPSHLSKESTDFLRQCFTMYVYIRRKKKRSIYAHPYVKYSDPKKRPAAASLLNHHEFCQFDPDFNFTVRIGHASTSLNRSAYLLSSLYGA
ncbi:kinase-like domain-containing protein [Dichotomocladium elegans]|nr:kinase-like domain-containing protein [Dichotomocladium elegans]